MKLFRVVLGKMDLLLRYVLMQVVMAGLVFYHCKNAQIATNFQIYCIPERKFNLDLF